ncbi:tetratricopeptide repeat protein [Singulisphaera acidiphila]|uniref:Tetratricopeptide repeat protein n=1 Tax=Singulisphaera acidiphila (strain ATCC BAA-1392 / DSM 18658 / VKM B-2454 / MOB10) TaxID=886293 RepID=L0DCH7_SINAD|nr:tetratricopeptide repeat protein [Singulisphaera acidiphila]AGA26543.1 hypothetical protein Sinac_2225 [Singulisphaera acidiphila DSM 18658]
MSSSGPDRELSGGDPGEEVASRGDSYEEIASWLQNEAERLFTQGQYGGAEQKVRQLLDLQNQVVGQEHADFALGLSMLGELRFLQGDLASAEGLFRRSLAIRGTVLGRSHPDYAVSLTCLAGMLWRRDALDEAEQCLREALAIRNDALGPDHPESVQGRKELVRILRNRGDWAGAQALIQPFLDPFDLPSGLSMGRDLSEDLVVLSSQFQKVGESFASVARSMSSVGAPPSTDSVRELKACRERFEALQGEAVERIQSLRIPNPPAIILGTLQDLASVLDDLADAELHQLEQELLRMQALAILDRVLALTFRNNPTFPPLRDCQEHVRQLRDSIKLGHWLDLPTQSESLADGTDALVSLLMLVEQPETLSDDDWADLYESVGESLGQPLAVAAARARLIVEDLPSHDREIQESTRTDVPRPVARSLPIAPEPTPRPTPRANLQGTLILDLAVASLVPSMGTLIHLPTASPSEPQAHRLLRSGRAPNVVEPSQTPTAWNALASQPPPDDSASPDGRERRQDPDHRAVPTIIAGPLSLLSSFGPILEPGARSGLFATSQLGSGVRRGEPLAKLPT